MKHLYLMLIAFLTITIGIAQTNIDCDSAETITLDANNESLEISRITITTSGVIPECENVEQNDAWYSFVMPFDGSLRVEGRNFSETQVYGNDCGNLVPLVCGPGQQYADGLLQGETYYIQAWKQIQPNNPLRFQIFAFELEDNQDCNSADIITFDANNETEEIDVDSDRYTQSGTIPSCENNEQRDAWYSFEMPFDGSLRIENTNFTETQLYSSVCGSLVPVICGGGQQYSDGLLQGETYYIQAWKQIQQGNQINFQIFAFEIADNQDCNSADIITFDANNETEQIDVDSDRYTPSGTIPSCENNEQRDAWYSFEMPINGTLRIDNTNFTETQVYSNDCGSLVPVICGSGVQIVDNLIAGEIYYIQAWKQIQQGNQINFQLTAFEVANNQDCMTATNLTFDVNNESEAINVDSDLYSASGVIPSCENEEQRDAWYSFEMPIDGNLIVTGTNFTDTQVYENVCGSLVPLNCGGGQRFSNNLTQGETYYIQAWKNIQQGNPIEFQLAAFEVIPNDECIDAIELTFDENNESQNTFSSGGATISENIASCQGTSNRDAWYRFTSPINGSFSTTGDQAREFAVYEPDEINCIGNQIHCGNGTTSFNVIQGEEYIFRVWQFSGVGDVSFNLIPATIPVSEISTGACVAIPDITIDATNNSEWINILDSQGDIVAAINANGNDLGTVSTSLFIDDQSEFLTYQPTGGDPIPYMRRFTTIVVSNQPTTPVSVRLYFIRNEFIDLRNEDDFISIPGDIGILKIEDQDCDIIYDGEAGDAITIDVQAYDIIDFSAEFEVDSFSKFLFLADDNTVLPVKLESFSAELVQSHVELDWATASEIDNSGFEIQRSTNGVDWNVIGWIVGNGSTAQRTEYEFTDASPYDGKNFYRLKQIDFDGAFDFSNVVIVEVNTGEQFIVYPNPVQNEIRFTGIEEQIEQIRIFNTTGLLMKTLDGINNNEAIDISQLSTGLYILEVQSANQIKQMKFLKQ